MRLAMLVVTCLLIPLQPLRAQIGPGQAQNLAGIKAFDPRVSLMGAVDELKALQLQPGLESRFELALRREGIGVSEDAPNFLSFEVVLLVSELGLVSYAVQLQLTEMRYKGERLEWVATWEALGVRTVGRDKFRESISEDLDENLTAFLNDYLTANPKKGG